MDVFAQRLRERAAQLGISEREAARRCDLEPRRFAHYVVGDREPDLRALVEIARKLGTTPNWLLGVDDEALPKKRAELLQRLLHAAKEMDVDSLKLLAVQAEAIAQYDGL
jgi:transcriptional regulator with XRE-family HTH domain